MANENDNMKRLVTTQEISGEGWRNMSPNNCPVIIRDGDGKSAGACWYYLYNGKCPSHGQIYEYNVISHKSIMKLMLSRIKHLIRGYHVNNGNPVRDLEHCDECNNHPVVMDGNEGA